MNPNVLKRLKSKWLWVGVAGLVYNALTEHFGVAIDSETYKMAVDVVSYVCIGVGVYSNHSE